MATRNRAAASGETSPLPPPGDWRLSVSGDDDGALTEPTEESAEERIARELRAEGADKGAALKIYRIKPDNSRAWCADISPAEFETSGYELIRRRFGPGRYELRLYAMTPTAAGMRYVVRAKPEIELAEDAAPSADAPGLPAPYGAAPASGAVEGLASVLREMVAATQRQHEAILRAIESARPPAIDPMANLRQTVELMGLMRAAMGVGASAPASPISEVLAAVRELRGAAQELVPRDEPEDPLTAALPRVLDLIQAAQRPTDAALPAVALPAGLSYAPNAEHGAPVPSAVPAPVSSAVPAPAPAPAPAAADPGEAELREAFAVFGRHVQAGNIEAASEQLYEFIPDEFLPMLGDASCIDALIAQAPELAAHRAALESVRIRVLAIIGEEEAAAPAP